MCGRGDDGLNRYGLSGSSQISYDPRGNLKGDGDWTYGRACPREGGEQ